MKIAAAIGGLLLVTQIVLLSIQLHVLRQSNGHIRSQDAKQTRLYPLQRASARNALPVLEQARTAISPLRRRASELARATSVLPDLATQLQQTMADVHALRGMTGTSLSIQRQSLALLEQSTSLQ